MAVVDLPAPLPGGGPGPGESLVFAEAGRRFTLRIVDAGLACCAVEVTAALRRVEAAAPLAASAPAHRDPDPGDTGPGGSRVAQTASAHGTPAGAGGDEASAPVHVLVVAGTVTDKLAPWVLRAYREMPRPVRVLSFGACANSGGPYWDSHCVIKGVDQLIPVDLYLPGCPPRPEALLRGLRMLAGQS